MNKHRLLRLGRRSLVQRIVAGKKVSSSSLSLLAAATTTATNILCRWHSSNPSAIERKENDDFDVLICGGGVVGAALAVQLQHLPLRIGLVDHGPAPSVSNNNASSNSSSDTNDGPIPHPRSYALSPASMKLLDLPESNSSTIQGYYDSMQVWEAGQPASLVLQLSDLVSSSSSSSSVAEPPSYLGCCVEDTVLQSHLYESLQSNVDVRSNTKLHNLQQIPTNDVLNNIVRCHLNDTPVSTRLLIAADGGHSAVRRHVGIPTKAHAYGQTALTCTVELTASLRRRAFQRFLPNGLPLALLPTWSDRHAVVVWSTTPAEVERWTTKNSDDDSNATLTRYFNELLSAGPEQLESLFDVSPVAPSSIWNNVLYGMDKLVDAVQYGTTMAAQHTGTSTFMAPPTIARVVSPKFTFPLSTQLPDRYTLGQSLALVGDAAHTVHPMAGQGLNLGLNDVETLAACVDRAVSAGMPPGTFLNDYETSRRTTVGLTVAGIHGLSRLYGSESVWMKHAKSLGMNFIQSVGPARRAVVEAACHGVVATNV